MLMNVQEIDTNSVIISKYNPICVLKCFASFFYTLIQISKSLPIRYSEKCILACIKQIN